MTWTYFLNYIKRQSGEDSDRISKVGYDVHNLFCHILRLAQLQRNSLDPLSVVICQSQDVSVSDQRRGQRSSDIQTKPLPWLFDLQSQHYTIIMIITQYKQVIDPC